MKTIKYLAFVLVCTAIFTTCKKYPEGGYINKGDNYIEGTWTLTLFEVNNVDSTALINYNGSEDYKKCKFFKYNSKYKDIRIEMEGKALSCYFTEDSKFLKVYTEIEYSFINCLMTACFKNYFVPEHVTYMNWEIIKLTKTKMILKSDLGKSYYLKFKKYIT